MKLIHRLLLICTLLMVTMSFTGCNTTLDQAGVYQGDTVLYQADKSIRAAYDTMHKLVTWEMEHREVLADYPAISEGTDQIRDYAKKSIKTAIALRKAYKLEPNSVNKDRLTSGLDVLQTALDQANKYLATPIRGP